MSLYQCQSCNSRDIAKCYGLIGGSSELKGGDKVRFYQSAASDGAFNKDGDEIFVHLDLKKYTLGYTINGEYCGVAFFGIEPGDYRVVISLGNRENVSKFVFL